MNPKGIRVLLFLLDGLQTIVLEDLTVSGYKLANRNDGVGCEEAKLAMKAFARYRDIS